MKTITKPLRGLVAADIMSKDLVMVPREMSLPGAARMLARAAVSGAPVVDENGACIGVLSTTDFMRSLDDGPAGAHAKVADCICSAWQLPENSDKSRCCVEDVMTNDPVMVTPGTTIRDLARMMMDAHIHRVIVVDGPAKKPIGIVSSMDILAAVARISEQTSAEAEDDRYARAGNIR